MKNLLQVSANSIADIASFKFNTPLRVKGIYLGNIKKIKLSLWKQKVKDITFPNKKIKANVGRTLESYRQIKNERNKALRFFMYYRLLECLAREERKAVDKLIEKHKIVMPLVKERRNPKSTRSLITHIRSKVHATKLEYKFPYRTFEGGSKQIEKVVREIILKVMNKQI